MGWRVGGCGGGLGVVERRKDKRIFTHGTQSERTAKEPGVWHGLLAWVIGSKPCREKK